MESPEEIHFSDFFGAYLPQLVEIYCYRMHWFIENTTTLNSAGQAILSSSVGLGSRKREVYD